MARLPTALDLPDVSPQQTRIPASSRPDPAPSGLANVGTVVADAAQTLLSAEQRIVARRDTIDRAGRRNALRQNLQETLTSFSTTMDLADPAAMDVIGAEFDKKVSEQIDAHRQAGASEDSVARLTERLFDIKAGYAGQASASALTAQKQRIATDIGQEVNSVMGRIAAPTTTIEESYQIIDNILEDSADSLTTAEMQQYRTAARSNAIAAKAEPLFRSGELGLQKMEEMLGRQDVASVLTPTEQSRYRTRIIVQRSEDAKAARAGARKIEELRQILGRDPTPAERVRAAGVAPSTERETLSAKIASLEGALGRPLTSPEIEKLGDIAGSEKGDFGSGLTGRALDIMTDDAPAFAAGLLSADQERRFMAAVTQYTQPTQFINDQGLPETRRPDLPPFVREALERRGMTVPQQQAGPPLAPAQPGAPQQPEQPTQQAPAGRTGPTLFERAGKTTGIVAGVKTAIGRTPGLGDMAGSMEETQNQQYATGLTNDIVRVMQNSPRFAEMERSQIKKEIGLEPSMFDTQTAYIDRMISVDTLLEERKQDAIKTINNRRAIGTQDYQRALTMLNDISNIQRRLGVPERVKSRQEFDKMVKDGVLRSGETFIDPDGNLRNVP
jgi:hypothetical protein